MQRSNMPILYSTSSDKVNKELLNIANVLSASYWNTPSEGVYRLQFLNPGNPVVNGSSPLPFNIIRYTPTDSNKSFEMYIPGRLNLDGTFEYGGGRKGRLSGDTIQWSDGSVWTKTNILPTKKLSMLNVGLTRNNAYSNNRILFGDIYNEKYLY